MKRNPQLKNVCKLNTLASNWPNRISGRREPNWPAILQELQGLKSDDQFFGRNSVPQLDDAIAYAKQNCKPKPKRMSKAQIMRDLGLVPVRGAVSGKIYWE